LWTRRGGVALCVLTEALLKNAATLQSYKDQICSKPVLPFLSELAVQLQEEFNFVSDEDFGRMNRLRLLELRDKEVQEFRNLAMVPSQEHEVMDSAFTVYERRLREKEALRSVGSTRVAAGKTLNKYYEPSDSGA